MKTKQLKLKCDYKAIAVQSSDRIMQSKRLIQHVNVYDLIKLNYTIVKNGMMFMHGECEKFDLLI